MPTTGDLKLNPGTEENPDSGYRSRFSHEKENAEAGYYKVLLEDYDIEAEMTASTRVWIPLYFSEKEETHIILELMSGIYN